MSNQNKLIKINEIIEN